MVDIDIAVARDRRRKAEKAARGPPDDPPMRGECAVCGRPVPAPVPPRKDTATPRFCDEHDTDDLEAMHEHFENMRHAEAEARRRDRYQQR